MDTVKIQQLLTQSLNTLGKENDGWALLSAVGGNLKILGLDYKAEGYQKLADLLANFSNLLETRQNDDGHPEIRLKKSPQIQIINPQSVKPAQKETLFEWAWMGQMKTVLEDLSNMALPETWEYQQDNGADYPYPVLYNYLLYTFVRLRQEHKIVEGEQYAAFNTGLVNQRYDEIFALFRKTEKGPWKWRFCDFCITGEEYAGKLLVAHFHELPKRTDYFYNAQDRFYNTGSGELFTDFEHICIERIERLPATLVAEHCPKGFTLKDAGSMDYAEQRDYYTDLAAAIKADSETYRALLGKLNAAVYRAVKQTMLNFRTAIPMYYPKHGKMSFLLPLFLTHDDKADIALVVERQASGNYQGQTILPLSLAYTDMRLVMRPDTNWLTVEKMDNTVIAEENNSMLYWFPQEERMNRTRISALMDEWKQETAKSQVVFQQDGKSYNGDQYFCADGFYPYYYHQKKKILFIARETVGMSGEDYIKDAFLAYQKNNIGGRTINQYHFHSRMMYLAYGILHDGEIPYSEVPWASEIAQTFGSKNGISFAFMELSKYSNDNDEDSGHDLALMTAFLRDSHLEKRNFFQEELAILDPDIVITMNLWETGLDDALLNLALGEVHTVDAETYMPSATLNTIAIKGKPVLLINLYHFSSRKNTETDFYEPVMRIIKRSLTDSRRETVKNKQGE